MADQRDLDRCDAGKTLDKGNRKSEVFRILIGIYLERFVKEKFDDLLSRWPTSRSGTTRAHDG